MPNAHCQKSFLIFKQDGVVEVVGGLLVEVLRILLVYGVAVVVFWMLLVLTGLTTAVLRLFLATMTLVLVVFGFVNSS